MSHILLTGASGFVGRNLSAELRANGHVVREVHRTPVLSDDSGTDRVNVGEITDRTDWGSVLDGVDQVVHVAARVHVTRETSADPLAAFRRINVEGAERLARVAAAAGVKRFLFISSIGVNGQTTQGKAFTETDPVNPVGPYAVSKWEAEQRLEALARTSGMSTVVVRPPLVYGPSAPGNFASLLRMVSRGFPLPFGAVQNLRSFIGIENLCDMLQRCLVAEIGPFERFVVSDDEDVSTADFIRLLAEALGRRPRLVPVPVELLRLGARLAQRPGLSRRLLDSLRIDCSHAKTVLAWAPRTSMRDGMRYAVGTR
jgi:nucleoside-diphosphate-sugar epimerase